MSYILFKCIIVLVFFKNTLKKKKTKVFILQNIVTAMIMENSKFKDYHEHNR